MFIKLAPLLALAVAGCTTVPQPVMQVSQHMRSHPYAPYAARDWRVLRNGEAGNCAAQSFTAMVELTRRGQPAQIVVCRLPGGQGHAYVASGAWVIDVRHPYPIPLSQAQQECR